MSSDKADAREPAGTHGSATTTRHDLSALSRVELMRMVIALQAERRELLDTVASILQRIDPQP